MAVVKIDDLKKYADGVEVSMPGFEGDTIDVLVRRPSLLKLAQDGKIPNQLLGAAASLFHDGSSSKDVSLKEMSEVLEYIAQACLVSPTYDEFVGAGLQLTDVQLVYLYNYSQTGLDEIRRFRNLKGTAAVSNDG